MSSTQRGAVRNTNDFYATPKPAFDCVLHLLPEVVIFWEPACGDGRLIRWINESGRVAQGTDLSDGYNFLRDTRRRDYIITNPPFSLALEFCRHALTLAPEVMMLLRLNFLGSKKRQTFFRTHEPQALFVLSDRPDFTGGGGDSCDYAWFYWGPRFAGIYHP